MPSAALDRVRDVFPDTEHRVARHTGASVNARIADAMEASIAWHAAHPHRIDRRLAELDREWDVERSLEANAAILSLAGLALAALADRRFLAVPAAVAGFLLQHSLQGWCPPVPVLRRLGVRTAAEIHAERTALKALRGDFEDTALIPGRKRKHAEKRGRAALRAAWR